MSLKDDPQAMREYKKEWIRARRRAWFDGKICVVCGSKEKLELDHIDPATKKTHAIWSWSEKRRNEELQKCQPLCRSCHKKKTINELHEKYAVKKHGISWTYKKHGCRCDLCKAAYSNERRKHYLSTGK